VVLSALDRRIATLILLQARRRWPLLSLVPAPWMRPLLAPAATRVRRSLTRAALALAVVTVVMASLLALLR
jgi:hypothetical protein